MTNSGELDVNGILLTNLWNNSITYGILYNLDWKHDKLLDVQYVCYNNRK